MTCGSLFLALAFCARSAEVNESQLPPPAKVTVDFTRDIKPIFEQTCWRCHGPEKPKSHFRLDNRESALKGGDNGIDIIPGNSGKSPLIHYVARVLPDIQMPPEGKGEPLTPEQVGLMRAWIDQGALWSTTNPPVQLAFSASPTLRWIGVNDDKSKFREVEGVQEGASGGLQEFSMEEQIGPDKKVSMSGHVLFPDQDFLFRLSLDQADVGFVHGGFEQWRKYYDDTGGYYQPFPVPSFSLNQDLHLDIGRAWVDLGLTLPHWPQIVIGYEYQYKDGAKSTLEWGDVNGKNIYPAFETIHEHVNVVKLDVTDDFNGWSLADNARVELYDSTSIHHDALLYTTGPVPDVLVQTRYGDTHIQGMNTLHLERQVTDWFLFSGGYLYSKFNGDATLNQTTTDAAGIPVTGTFWSTEPINLERDSQVFSLGGLLLPGPGLSLSLGVQNEWQHEESFGNISLDEGDPDVPQSFLLQPATVQSDLDTMRVAGNAGLRYTAIPFSVVFANFRYQYEDISQFEQELGDVPSAFLRDTDAVNDQQDLRAGISTSPWRWFSFSAEYRNAVSDTDYNNLRDINYVDLQPVPGNGYSAFITHRKIDSDQAQAKLVLRPAKWIKTTFTFRTIQTDYHTTTDPALGPLGVQASPGGTIFAGNYDAHVYGVNMAITPFYRLTFSGAFTYSDSRMITAANGDPSIVPYQGNIYTATADAHYLLNTNVTLTAAYAFSHSGFGEANVADGLPLGLNYTRQGFTIGINRRFNNWLSSSLRYAYYRYSEPSTGGFNDYSANGVFGTLTIKWK